MDNGLDRTPKVVKKKQTAEVGENIKTDGQFATVEKRSKVKVETITDKGVPANEEVLDNVIIREKPRRIKVISWPKMILFGVMAGLLLFTCGQFISYEKATIVAKAQYDAASKTLAECKTLTAEIKQEQAKHSEDSETYSRILRTSTKTVVDSLLGIEKLLKNSGVPYQNISMVASDNSSIFSVICDKSIIGDKTTEEYLNSISPSIRETISVSGGKCKFSDISENGNMVIVRWELIKNES